MRPLSRAEATTIAKFHWVLADPCRVQVLDRIAVQGETSTPELAAAIPGLSYSGVIYHFRILRARGLIERHRVEQAAYRNRVEQGAYRLTLTAAGKAITELFRLDGAE